MALSNSGNPGLAFAREGATATWKLCFGFLYFSVYLTPRGNSSAFWNSCGVVLKTPKRAAAMAELPAQSAPQAAEAAPTARTNSSGSHLEVGGASRVDTCAVAACGHVDVLLRGLQSARRR